MAFSHVYGITSSAISAIKDMQEFLELGAATLAPPASDPGFLSVIFIKCPHGSVSKVPIPLTSNTYIFRETAITEIKKCRDCATKLRRHGFERHPLDPAYEK